MEPTQARRSQERQDEDGEEDEEDEDEEDKDEHDGLSMVEKWGREDTKRTAPAPAGTPDMPTQFPTTPESP